MAAQATFSTAEDQTPPVAAARPMLTEPAMEQAWKRGPSPAQRPRLVCA
jgi:hypothetical protein